MYTTALVSGFMYGSHKQSFLIMRADSQIEKEQSLIKHYQNAHKLQQIKAKAEAEGEDLSLFDIPRKFGDCLCAFYCLFPSMPLFFFFTENSRLETIGKILQGNQLVNENNTRRGGKDCLYKTHALFVFFFCFTLRASQELTNVTRFTMTTQSFDEASMQPQVVVYENSYRMHPETDQK